MTYSDNSKEQIFQVNKENGVREWVSIQPFRNPDLRHISHLQKLASRMTGNSNRTGKKVHRGQHKRCLRPRPGSDRHHFHPTFW